MKHVVDSSAWIAYLQGSESARHFSGVIEQLEDVIVPSIVLYEVFKKVSMEMGKESALQVLAHMQQCQIVGIDASTALTAASLSMEHKLPMADSLILAVTRHAQATLWTQDADFEGLPGVHYFAKT